MKTPNWLIYRLNKNLIAMILAFILVISGIIMTMKGIKETGEIDIASSFLSGKLKTGSVGLLFTFLGFMTAGMIILKDKKPHRLKIKKDKIELEWEGRIDSYDDAMTIVSDILCKLSRAPIKDDKET